MLMVHLQVWHLLAEFGDASQLQVMAGDKACGNP
jgi:hypothetical protein